MSEEMNPGGRAEGFERVLSYDEFMAREAYQRRDFFSGISQQKLYWDGCTSTSPTFYHDMTALTGVFKADYRVMKKLFPYHPELRFLRGGYNTAYFGFMCLNNRSTDLGPYREVNLITPMMNPHQVGQLSLLSTLFPAFELYRQQRIARLSHHFIWRLLVNSYPAYTTGERFFGMPKLRASIDWQESDREHTITVSDDDELMFRICASKLPTRTNPERELVFNRAYNMRDRVLMPEDLVMHPVEQGMSKRASDFRLELGAHHLASQVGELIKSTECVQYIAVEQAEWSIYEPGRWAPDVVSVLPQVTKKPRAPRKRANNGA